MSDIFSAWFRCVWQSVYYIMFIYIVSCMTAQTLLLLLFAKLMTGGLIGVGWYASAVTLIDIINNLNLIAHWVSPSIARICNYILKDRYLLIKEFQL